MSYDSYMPIREFSRLTGLTADTLRFYDRIGLLVPEFRKENGYRFYTGRQLNFAYLISLLRGIGVGLDEIKHYTDDCTLEGMFSLLSKQEAHIQEEMNRLGEMKEIMHLYADMANEVLIRGRDAIYLEEREREPVLYCPRTTGEEDDAAGEIRAYEYAKEQGINTGYPMGCCVALSVLEERRAFTVSRRYFKVRRGSNGWKPGGSYAVAYGKSQMWKPDLIYQKALEFIRARGLEPKGEAYEEYPMDEMALQGGTAYLVRIEIPVGIIAFSRKVQK